MEIVMNGKDLKSMVNALGPPQSGSFSP